MIGLRPDSIGLHVLISSMINYRHHSYVIGYNYIKNASITLLLASRLGSDSDACNTN